MSRAFDNTQACAQAENRRSLPTRPIGPIAPSNGQVMLYALDSEESSITQPEEEFSARAREIDREYVRVNSGYALSVLPSSRPEDLFILDRVYEADLPLIEWMRDVYLSLSIEFSERIYFAEPKNFSAVVSDLLVAVPEVCAVSTICYSHNLGRRFPCADEIAASGYLNSKTTLGDLSRKHSFVIPESLITTVGELGSVAKTKFRFPDEPVYMKVDGLGGGYNVRRISTEQDLTSAITDYGSDQECVVQRAIDESYTETIHLFTVSDSAVEYRGSRMKITADDQWYGNIFIPELSLNDEQRRTVYNAAEGARREGYVASEPLWIGFDGFMNEHELVITEINARWLGSSPPELLMRRLGIFDELLATSTFDYVADEELASYQAWIERNLFSRDRNSSAEFSVLPMALGGHRYEGCFLVNNIIIGDLHACAEDIAKNFSNRSFTMLDNTIATFDKVMARGIWKKPTTN